MRSRKMILGETGGVGIRKLMKLRKEIAVSIPIEFLERHGLRGGDEVAVFFDGEFVVRPLRHPDPVVPLEEKK